MQSFSRSAILMSLLVCAPSAQGSYFLVNTGPGPASLPGWVVGEGTQWLGSEFSIDRAATVTDVRGWLCCGSGTLEIAILTDDGEIPGSVVYSATLETDLNAAGPLARWTGLSGLQWHLEPGTYWISLGDDRASIPGGSVSLAAPYPAVFPLGNDAIWWGPGNTLTGWSPVDSANNPIDFDFGVQIVAEGTPDGKAPRPVCWSGNGHCYENVGASQITWHQANTDAATFSFGGARGHLATITSQDEQNFIDATVLPPPEQSPPFGGNRGWIGGFQAGDGAPFEWVTGETFDYTDWRSGEPRGDVGNNFIELNWELADWNDTADFDPAIDGYLVEYPIPARVSCLGDVNSDGVTDIAVVTPDGRVQVKDLRRRTLGGFRLDTVPRLVDVDFIRDTDGDGVGELLGLSAGTGVVAAVRAVPAGERLRTVAFNADRDPLELELIGDRNGNGAEELAVLAREPNRVEVRDGLTGTLLNLVSYASDLEPRDLAVYPDLDGNGAPELAVLGDNRDARRSGRIEIRDVATGASVGDIWLGGGWRALRQALLSDGKGAREVAVLRVRDSDGAVNVMLRDIETRRWLGALGFDRNYPPTQFLTLPDLNGNGADEVVVFGRRFDGRNQKAQVKDSKTKAIIRPVFFDRNFAGEDLTSCPDIDGNGADELVLLGRRPGDGQLKVMVRDARTGALLGTIFY